MMECCGIICAGPSSCIASSEAVSLNILPPLQARDKGVPTTPVERKQRQGLGKVGPLRFRNLARAISRDKEEQEAGQDSGTAAATAEHVEPKAEDSSAANNQQ